MRTLLLNLYRKSYEEVKNLELQLYPNPATTSINVLIGSPKKDKIIFYITNIAGKEIKQFNQEVPEGTTIIRREQ